MWNCHDIRTKVSRLFGLDLKFISHPSLLPWPKNHPNSIPPVQITPKPRPFSSHAASSREHERALAFLSVGLAVPLSQSGAVVHWKSHSRNPKSAPLSSIPQLHHLVVSFPSAPPQIIRTHVPKQPYILNGIHSETIFIFVSTQNPSPVPNLNPNPPPENPSNPSESIFFLK